VEHHVAEKKRVDPPALAVVGELLQHLGNAQLNHKLGETVHEARGSWNYAVRLATLKRSKNRFAVLREQNPIPSLDICSHTTRFDNQHKRTCVEDEVLHVTFMELAVPAATANYKQCSWAIASNPGCGVLVASGAAAERVT
jgi:ligand-binding SRPBCC domain-containing protein